MAVSSIDSAVNVLNQLHANGTSKTSESSTFKDFLSQAIDQAEITGEDNRAFSDALLSGELNNIHDANIASNEAELALSLTVQIRDRLVEAYNEIIRMQV